MPIDFPGGSRALQDRFDTRRLADRLNERRVHDRFTDDDRAFIEARDMFLLATADEQGRPTCSYKGGAPGFVRVLDDTTLAFPSYDGNGMFLSMGNLAGNPHVGLLFLDLEGGRRIRVQGSAAVDAADPLLGGWPEAQLVVRVRAEAIFPNCPRYLHSYRQVERSRFVPETGRSSPVPDWKRTSWAADVLPAGDPARAPGEDGAP